MLLPALCSTDNAVVLVSFWLKPTAIILYFAPRRSLMRASEHNALLIHLLILAVSCVAYRVIAGWDIFYWPDTPCYPVAVGIGIVPVSCLDHIIRENQTWQWCWLVSKIWRTFPVCFPRLSRETELLNVSRILKPKSHHSCNHNHNRFTVLFSRTTRVSWCQKRTSGLYGARED